MAVNSEKLLPFLDKNKKILGDMPKSTEFKREVKPKKFQPKV